MFKVILYSTVSFFLLSLNVALADEEEIEGLDVPEYQDAPPAEMTGERNEPQVPTEMMPETEGSEEYVEAPNEENTNAENPHPDEAINTEENATPVGDEQERPEGAEQNQGEQPQTQEGAPVQDNTQAQENISAEEAEAKHAEEVELREVGAGEEEGMQ